MLTPLPNTSFSGLLQVAWDNTSVSALKECPRKYYYTIVLGFQPRTLSIHLTFGLIYHRALELYDHARAQGQDHESGVRVATRHCLIATWNPQTRRPWDSQDSYKNRFTLTRSVVWYLEQFQDDPLETVILANGKPAVELSFRVETNYSTPEGQPYLYCGHLDRLAWLGGGPGEGDPWIVDRKTTKSTLGEWYFESFTPNAQFSGYVFGGKIALALPIKGLIVDAAQIAVGFSAFQRSPVTRSPGQIQEWYTDLGQWLRVAEGYAEANYWPMNESSCGNYGGCSFREICSHGPGNTRDTWLSKTMSRRTWDPLVARGDV